jgi:hypothetical protein
VIVVWSGYGDIKTMNNKEKFFKIYEYAKSVGGLNIFKKYTTVHPTQVRRAGYDVSPETLLKAEMACERILKIEQFQLEEQKKKIEERLKEIKEII